MTAHSRFLLLLALFAVSVLVHQFVLPPMEGPDEPVHYTYVEYVRAFNDLPDRATYLTNSTRQESGQPPLVYWLAGLPLRALNVPQRDGEVTLDYLYNTVRNRWVVPNVATGNLRDNLNLYYHGRAEAAFGLPDVVTANRLMRLTPLLLSVLAVVGAYAAALEVFGRSSWALLAAALFAFNPTFMIAASTINNDIGAITFSALATWGTLRLLRRGASPSLLAVIGLLLGLAALSKINMLLLLPAVGLALLLAEVERGFSWRRLLAHGLILGFTFSLVFAPWVVYGIVNYADPIGINTHQHGDPRYYFAELLPLGTVLSQLDDTYLSYWGAFSPRGTNLFSTIVVSLIVVFALAGYVVRGRFGLRSRQLIVLAVMAFVSFLGLIYWMQRQSDVTARLMFPAHAAVVILLVAGLYRLAARWAWAKRPLQLYSFGIIALVGLILSPIRIELTFGLPRFRSPDELPSLVETPIDYDGAIRFLGYAQPSPLITGNEHEVTLCWRVLATTTKPAAFSLKFVHDGLILADRTSVHGLGHLNSVSWLPGDTFCDTFDLFIDDPDLADEPPPQPGQVYDMLLILIDASTLESDWTAAAPDGTALEYPVIGQVAVPAGDMSAAVSSPLTETDITFPGFARLRGYALDAPLAPGATVQLDLLWDVDGQTADNWSQFFHLVGQDTGILLADSLPRAGNYPTWAWRPGERVADSWTLQIPADLAPGQYTINTGFYRQDTGERLPILHNGQPVPDHSSILLQFEVQ